MQTPPFTGAAFSSRRVLVEQAFRAHAANGGSAGDVRDAAELVGRSSLGRVPHSLWVADDDSFIAALARSISIFGNHLWLVDARADQGD